MGKIKPTDRIFYNGKYHNDVFFDGKSHYAAYMDVDGELECVWLKNLILKYGVYIIPVRLLGNPYYSKVMHQEDTTLEEDLTPDFLTNMEELEKFLNVNPRNMPTLLIKNISSDRKHFLLTTNTNTNLITVKDKDNIYSNTRSDIEYILGNKVIVSFSTSSQRQIGTIEEDGSITNLNAINYPEGFDSRDKNLTGAYFSNIDADYCFYAHRFAYNSGYTKSEILRVDSEGNMQQVLVLNNTSVIIPFRFLVSKENRVVGILNDYFYYSNDKGLTWTRGENAPGIYNLVYKYVGIYNDSIYIFGNKRVDNVWHTYIYYFDINSTLSSGNVVEITAPWNLKHYTNGVYDGIEQYSYTRIKVGNTTYERPTKYYDFEAVQTSTSGAKNYGCIAFDDSFNIYSLQELQKTGLVKFYWGDGSSTVNAIVYLHNFPNVDESKSFIYEYS